jgi:hypothetical protein
VIKCNRWGLESPRVRPNEKFSERNRTVFTKWICCFVAKEIKVRLKKLGPSIKTSG